METKGKRNKKYKITDIRTVLNYRKWLVKETVLVRKQLLKKRIPSFQRNCEHSKVTFYSSVTNIFGNQSIFDVDYCEKCGFVFIEKN